MPKIKSPGKFRPKPKRHPGRCDADDCDLDSSNLLQNGRLNFYKWVLRVWKFTGRFSFHQYVRGKDRHVRSLQCILKAFHPPIEFMIADDPSIVFEMVEQIDHERAIVSKADVSALVNVTDVDQYRVRIFTPPTFDLRRATRESAAIWTAIIINSWQNVTM